MLLTSLFAFLFISFAQADTKDASDATKISNLLPEPDVPLTYETINRGRSDIEIEQDQPFVGYFYPKPEKPFSLPEFKTVNPDASIASFSGEESFEEVGRPPRSPRRRPPYYRPGFMPPGNNNIPPFIPGFIPPNNMRPLPALYARGY